MVCAEPLPHIRRAVSAATDSIVDMSGPGAVTVYSTLRYLVLTLTTEPDLELTEWNETLRGALIAWPGTWPSCSGPCRPPPGALRPPPRTPGLPRVVHVHTLNASMVPGIGTGIYGYTPHALPVLLHPNEILDGAITGDAVVGYPGKCTWLHVNNPVLPALYARHGTEYAWVGSIVSRTRWGGLAEKQRSAYQTAKLASMLGATGALVTWNHGGNDLIEVMLTIQGLERAGIRTVFLTIESDIKVVRLRPGAGRDRRRRAASPLQRAGGRRHREHRDPGPRRRPAGDGPAGGRPGAGPGPGAPGPTDPGRRPAGPGGPVRGLLPDLRPLRQLRPGPPELSRPLNPQVRPGARPP